MKERMVGVVPELEDFTASNGWLESFRIAYGIRETTTTISGEAGDVNITTVKAWMERLPEISAGYTPDNILNMDELGLFFKTLPNKGLVQKGKKGRGGKQSKKRCTVALFVAADGSKVCDPIVIWRYKNPRCFKTLKNKFRPNGVYYFGNKKAWMTTEIMKEILKILDTKMIAQQRHVQLYMDNAPCHPESLQLGLKNTKIVLLPKNTTSRLQPCDAGIIRIFKLNYRNLLVRYVVSRIDANQTASDIVGEITILKVISWIQEAWAGVQASTIKHCFEKCGFGEPNTVRCTQSDETDDAEFDELLKELGGDTSVDEFVDFDTDAPTCQPDYDTESVSWRDDLRFHCIQSVINKGIPEEDSNSESDEEFVTEPDNVTSIQALDMLEKIRCFFESREINADIRKSIATLTEATEKMQIISKRQMCIEDYFSG